VSADERAELIELRAENAKLRKEVRDLTWTILAQTKSNAAAQPAPAKPERADVLRGGKR
jgi:hypothetical protein